MNRKDREMLLGGWLNSLCVGSALPVFLDMIHSLVEDSIEYQDEDLI